MKVKRNIYSKLINEIEKPYISILIGPRQVGKSFLLNEIMKYCKKKGFKTHFFNMELPADLRTLSGTDEEVINTMMQSRDIIFMDEFHYLKNATKIFKVLYDSKKSPKIFASGSSSVEIHKHLKESLAGRYRPTGIMPLQLSELKQIKDYKSRDYLIMGGMPGLIHEKTFNEKINLLENIVQTYLMKDIRSLIKEENIRSFNQLMYILAQNQGSTITTASLAREIRLSEPAVQYHLELLDHTYVCTPLHSYSGNLANELKKVKKYYLYDNGIRNSLLNDFSAIDARNDRGIILESYIFHSIYKQLQPNMEVRFWRTRQGDEVDFILIKNRVPVPLEVKYNLKKPEIPEGMKKFLIKYKQSPKGIVVSLNFMGTTEFDGREIEFITWENAEKISYLENE